MNQNKGFIGIGLIIAIVLGIVMVGGGAYYLGKSSKVGNKEVVENNINIPINQEENQNLPVVDDQKNSTSSITVLSPNGGETFSTSTTIKQIPVTWKSSGIVSKNVAFYIKNMSTGIEEPNGIYPDNGSTNIYGIPAGIYKIRICSTIQKSVKFEVIYEPDCSTASDYSDNSFIINSLKVSNELPEYIRSAFNSWPPIIKHSSINYSCTLSHTQNQDVIEKIINNKKYCITDYYEGAAGTIYHTYTYVTSSINGVGTETSNFTVGYGCGGYGGPGGEQYDQCNLNETTFKNNLDTYIVSLM